MGFSEKQLARLLGNMKAREIVGKRPRPKAKRQRPDSGKAALASIKNTLNPTFNEVYQSDGRVLYTLTIFGWRPATTNELLRHKMAGHRLKKRDREVVGFTSHLLSVPKATRKRLVTLEIVLGPGDRKCDPDAYWKSTLDALVHAKLLVDDRPSCVALAPVQYVRGEQTATRITLEDIS